MKLEENRRKINICFYLFLERMRERKGHSNGSEKDSIQIYLLVCVLSLMLVMRRTMINAIYKL